MKDNSIEVFFFGGLAVERMALNFHFENMLYCSLKKRKKKLAEAGGGTSSLLLLPLKLRYGADLLPFGVSPLANGSITDL